MKKISCVRWFVIYLITLGFASCSGDDSAPAPELTVSVEQLAFSNAGETKSFYIKSNISWSVSSAESWCTVTPSSGEKGTIKIEVTTTKNESASTRTSLITAIVGSVSKQITVTQAANVLLTVGQNEYDVDEAGDEITIQVQNSGTYSVDIDSDWITSGTGSDLNNPKFEIESNPALIGRTGTITFSLNGVTQVVTINQSGVPLTIPEDNTGMTSDAMSLSKKMKVGWNLGNTLEATGVNNGVYTASETSWGNPKTSKTLIDAVKAAGFNTVRLPCAWSGYLENETNYRIKNSWLSRVKEVTDYCVQNEMYVIINIHWDGGWLENNPTFAKQVEVNKKQKALWEQIAAYFRDYDEHLLFAGTNEVHADYGNPTSENIQVQQSFNQTFVDAVRSTGGRNANRILIVQAYNTNITLARDYMTMPTDASVSNRLMAEVHFYDPYDFTLDENSTKYLWGADFAGNANAPTWGQEAWVDEAFGIVKTKFVDNGIPVILGEYAAILRSSLTSAALANHIAARNYYLHYVTKAALDNGMVPVYWDAGATGNNSTGLFNRATGQQAHSDTIDAIVSALN